nr:MAG TPA_asm: hypothetical protein [Bacteriophage sp.]
MIVTLNYSLLVLLVSTRTDNFEVRAQYVTFTSQESAGECLMSIPVRHIF